MANPVLNEQTFAPEHVAQWRGAGPQAPARVMTVDGTIFRSLIMLALLVGAGTVGWVVTPTSPEGQVAFPGWMLVPMLAGIGVALVVSFKPTFAPIGGPLYALGYGLVVGAISKAFESFYSGIVLQAVLLTAVVFAVMLGLYTSRAIRVTPRLRLTIIGATLGILVVYLGSFVLGFFGVDVPFLGNGVLGLLFSVLVAGVAAFNLLLDFDIIERGAQAGAPVHMSWYAAFGLTVTLVWLYLSILRVLAILAGNR